jgi:hypothetical protein
MDVPDDSGKDFTAEDHKVRAETQKQLIDQLKTQWKLLWSQRYDDRVRAEGVSVNDYAILDIERGTIIHATKDFKILSLKQILEKYNIENAERHIPPDVNIGGWNKFIQTEIKGKAIPRGSRAAAFKADESATKKKQQAKKSGRGWLHKA